MLIDTHCHFFTKSMLSQTMVNYADALENERNGRGHDAAKIKEAQRMIDFLHVGYCHDCQGLYQYMEKAYDQKFIAVPLMLDVTYALSAPSNRSEEKSEYFFQYIRQEIKKASNGRERFAMWVDQFLSTVQKSIHLRNKERVSLKVFDNSYEEQLRELQSVKKMLPDHVYPFYSIDPRRDGEFQNGVLGEIKKYVGSDKPFIGLKLYSSLGYSPTDPVLYGGGSFDSVYGWCEEQQIPITVHCSYSGFSHMLDYCDVRGDVYYPAAGKVVPVELLYEDGMIPFGKSIMDYDLFEVAEERLLLLTHPFLWQKVLEKYPKLRINFAHCGGRDQLVKYALGDATAFWPEQILKMVCDYPNVYADLSCFDTTKDQDHCLGLVHDQVYCKLPLRAQKKLLYGSDFYMIFLYNEALDGYYYKFVDAFGSDFDTISRENPIQFLNINKGWIN